jgi:hypothetical protein
MEEAHLQGARYKAHLQVTMYKAPFTSSKVQNLYITLQVYKRNMVGSDN